MAGSFPLPFDVPEVDYTRYTNRQLAAVPLALLALALVVIIAWYVVTGAPVNLGLEFTGGTELQIRTSASEAQIRQSFEAEIASIQPVRSQANTYILTFQSTNTAAIEESAERAGYEVLLADTVSPSFGGETQQLAIYGVLAAFVGMSVVVFLLFRSFVPSAAVVLSAFSDIVIPIALMNLLGIELSLGTVAALLMLIGYSVDSDILLTNHILRRSGSFYESTYRAMRTGVTMTLTSLAAVTVMAISASLFGVQLLAAIGTVLAFGLVADLMNTYLLNLSLLRWYKFEGVAR